MKTCLFILFQYLVPQAGLSRLAGKLANCEKPWLKNNLIKSFIRFYNVDMSAAAKPEPESYACFNDFFTRQLAEGQRPIDTDDAVIISPVDGSVSQLGTIEQDRIFQAKGQHFTLLELLGGQRDWVEPFYNGQFATLYLSPRDYHRVHMPIDGKLEETFYIPGALFSVNNQTAAHVPKVFARNERLVCLFSTALGPMAVIMVGAMIVAGIETTWAGQVNTNDGQTQAQSYRDNPQTFHKGDELGRFKLGSTVILLFGEDALAWKNGLAPSMLTKMGERLGTAG